MVFVNENSINFAAIPANDIKQKWKTSIRLPSTPLWPV
jgi:hypothetical protein